MPYFEIVTADGKTYAGEPMGRGGPLGGGAGHVGEDAMVRVAESELTSMKRTGSRLRLWPVIVGQVPHSVFLAHTNDIEMKGATWRHLAWAEAQRYAIVGEPEPSLD